MAITLVKLPFKAVALAAFLVVKLFSQIAQFFTITIATVCVVICYFIGALSVLSFILILMGRGNFTTLGVAFFIGCAAFFFILPKLLVYIPVGLEALASGLWFVVREW